MKLWLLEMTSAGGDDAPAYDVLVRIVVRAMDEEKAREFAAEWCGDEGRDFWFNPRYATCEELTPEGEAGPVMRDFANG